MVAFIRSRIERAAFELDKEVSRFHAFFGVLRETPQFLRILNKADIFAPQLCFVPALRRARSRIGGDFA